ncbi:MAG TPA: Mur ligase family protein, partial [Rubrivivax sp.]|nr:Mur ligase family protein [Rubrivivax sp.]
MARWCARCGAQVTVADTREEPPQRQALLQTVPQARFVSGPFSPELLEGKHAVFRSPGLSPAQVAPVFEAARSRGLRAESELGLFAEALRRLALVQGYAPSVLAVTGTNGKTTVTALAGQLVERAGKRTAVAGNIGPTLLETLSQYLEAGELPQVWVIELSSF